MGSRPIPPYANIFMAKKINVKLTEIAAKCQHDGIDPIKFLKGFLDDLFTIWIGSPNKLHLFHEEINKIHPYNPFTPN